MPADFTPGNNQKVIDLKVAPSRRRKKVTRILLFTSILSWLALTMLLADKYHYHYWHKPAVPAVVAVTPQPTLPKAEVPKVVSEAPHDFGDEPVLENKQISPAAVPSPVVIQEDMKPAISTLGKRIDKLEAANNNLLVYFGARDLKDSLEDPENFKEQLSFLKLALAGDLNVGGKIDILEQATGNGLVTKAKLLSDLKVLQKNLDQSSNHGFSGSIKSAFGNLVKVTKTDGEVEVGDYNSVLKRAEIALTRPKLSTVELQNVINEIKKLGKPGEDFVKEANNLERVVEVTDYLVVYTKSHTLQTGAKE